jgi:hypothetical protein
MEHLLKAYILMEIYGLIESWLILLYSRGLAQVLPLTGSSDYPHFGFPPFDNHEFDDSLLCLQNFSRM